MIVLILECPIYNSNEVKKELLYYTTSTKGKSFNRVAIIENIYNII